MIYDFINYEINLINLFVKSHTLRTLRTPPEIVSRLDLACADAVLDHLVAHQAWRERSVCAD